MAYPRLSAERLGRWFFLAERHAVVFMAEARVREAATSGDNNVIAPYESAVHDLGLYTGNDALPRDVTERFIHMLKKYKDIACVVPIEIKDIAPQLFRRKYGLEITWGFILHGQQVGKCQAIICTAAADVERVALIPRWYFRGLDDLSAEAERYQVRTAIEALQWFLHATPAFPPEWAPFVFEISKLGQALSNLREFVRGTSEHWTHPCNGVICNGVPRPKIYDMSVLGHEKTLTATAFNSILPVLAAFKKHSTEYAANFVDMAPMNGDCVLLHLSSGIKTFVEVKSEHYRMELDSRTRESYLHHNQRAIGQGHLIFSWRAHWDFILTISQDLSRAFFIPRDMIPDAWWNVIPASTSQKTMVRAPYDYLSRFKVRYGNSSHLVTDMERILSSNPRQATKLIPMVPTLDYEIGNAGMVDAVEDDEGIVLTDDEEPANVGGEVGQIQNLHISNHYPSSFRMGFGSIQHSISGVIYGGGLKDRIYQVWASQVLWTLFREEGRCVLLDLGTRHPVCRFFVADWQWSESDKRRYDVQGRFPIYAEQIDSSLPVVPVHFIDLFWHRGGAPLHRDVPTRFRMIANQPRCIVIADTVPYRCLRMAHGRFIIAGDQFPLPKSSDFDTEGNLRLATEITFEAETMIIDHYSVDTENVVSTLATVVKGEGMMGLGNFGHTVQRTEYLHTWGDLLQQSADAFKYG